MKKQDFYYDLPKELIAQDPLEDRSSSRMLVLGRTDGIVSHHVFKDITGFLKKGDCLVLNDTKVIPARLFGERISEGITQSKKGKTTDTDKINKDMIEFLLLKRHEGDAWESLVKPGKKAKIGTKIFFGNGLLTGEIINITTEGNRIIKFSYNGVFEEILDKLGQMPLPPYITHTLKDKNRYQTVYAKWEGSAAAPTAGLHFTNELLSEIQLKGISIAKVTLHVGLGTFRPVKDDNIFDHHMHSEFYQVNEEEAEKINKTRKDGGRIICVGTTSCRTVESASDTNGIIHAGSGETDIFIYPGYKFKVLDGLITNFHLPESTLLMLISALAGRENVLNAYKKAVDEKYRFFSFGDAMLIV